MSFRLRRQRGWRDTPFRRWSFRAAPALVFLGALFSADATSSAGLFTFLRRWFIGLLALVGLAAPKPSVVVESPLEQPTVAQPVVGMPTAIKGPRAPASGMRTVHNAMPLNSIEPTRRYTYLFEGVATWRGKPCERASVLVRLTSGQDIVTRGTITGADGSYTIEIPIEAAPDSPVDWTMEAYTPEFKKVELVGRRIVSREETTIVVQKPLEFASLPR